MTAQEVLRMELGQRIGFRERRPGIDQILAPIFHEDGDMVDLFLDTRGKNPDTVRLTDAGLTLMKLSYSFDLDTPNKRRLFEKIVSENQVQTDAGELFIDTSLTDLGISFLHLSQVLAKVSSLQYLKRQVVSTLFYEQLAEFIEGNLQRFEPRAQFSPLPDRPELEADYIFQSPQKPIFLFGVKDSSKARLSAISCLEYQKRNLPFRSVVVNEDFESLKKKDQRILINASDKQFFSLRDFIEDGEKFFDREAA